MPSNPLAEAHHALVRQIARLEVEPASVDRMRWLGLHMTHVGCEDSVRSVGPTPGAAIGDMTIQVQSRRQGQYFATSMPALRALDFADRCAEPPIAAIRLRVGDERGSPLRTIGLREYLGDLRAHLTRPDSWAGAGTSLLAARDSRVELRAQACCLPVPQAGPAAFTPVVFEARARAGAPAVLAILATREGTSATVVDNERDHTRLGRRSGQHLLHNRDGRRVGFTGAQLDARASGTGPVADTRALVLIQVPLRQPPPPPDPYEHWDITPMHPERGVRAEEPLVIDPRAFAGPHVEIDGLAIERDESRPISVTVQLLRPTREPVLDDDALVELAAQIERVYADADAVAALLGADLDDPPRSA